MEANILEFAVAGMDGILFTHLEAAVCGRPCVSMPQHTFSKGPDYGK